PSQATLPTESSRGQSPVDPGTKERWGSGPEDGPPHPAVHPLRREPGHRRLAVARWLHEPPEQPGAEIAVLLAEIHDVLAAVVTPLEQPAVVEEIAVRLPGVQDPRAGAGRVDRDVKEVRLAAIGRGGDLERSHTYSMLRDRTEIE